MILVCSLKEHCSFRISEIRSPPDEVFSVRPIDFEEDEAEQVLTRKKVVAKIKTTGLQREESTTYEQE